jgi:hypothetical protein
MASAGLVNRHACGGGARRCSVGAVAASAVEAGSVDLVLLAGNVMIFLEPDTEGAVLRNLVGQLDANGLLVAGFSLQPGQLSCDAYDAAAATAGLIPVARWASWDRRPFAGGDYAVTVHRRLAAQ